MLKKTGKKLFWHFLKIYYSFSLVCYKPWDRGKLQLSQNTVKIQYLTPPLTFTKAAAGHAEVWGVPLELIFDTHWTVSVLVGVKRVYKRALQGLYFT